MANLSNSPAVAGQALIKQTRLWVTYGYYTAFVALGLTTASLGPTLSRLAENTQTQFSQIGILFTARSMGYLLGSFLGGRLYDRFSGNPIIGAMLILMAVGLAIVPTLSMLWFLVLVLLLIGVVEGVVDVGGNTLLVWLHGEGVGPYMNALHFFFGLGAFLSPIIIAQALLYTEGILWGYWILSLLIVPVSIWVLRLPSPSLSGQTDDELPAVVNKSMLALFAFFFFLFVAGEISFAGWIASYAEAMNLASAAEAAYLTAGFFGAFTLGRLLSIPIAARLRYRTILLADLVGCLLSLGILLLWPRSLAATWAGAIGFGLSLASLFPTTISLAGRHMVVTGRVTGWFLIGGALGGMTLPGLIGRLFDRFGPGSVIWAVFADFVLGLVVFFVLILLLNRKKSEMNSPRL